MASTCCLVGNNSGLAKPPIHFHWPFNLLLTRQYENIISENQKSYLKQKVSLLASTFCDQDGRQEGFLCNWWRFLDGNFVQPSRSWLWH